MKFGYLRAAAVEGSSVELTIRYDLGYSQEYKFDKADHHWLRYSWEDIEKAVGERVRVSDEGDGSMLVYEGTHLLVDAGPKRV